MTRRRNLTFDEDVNEFLSCWQGRDHEFSILGQAPLGKFISALIRRSKPYREWVKTGKLPALGKLAKGGEA